MELHPYDGVERRYRHSDPDRTLGLAVVAYLLGLPGPPPPDGLCYDLEIYSGGIGVLDSLAIALPSSCDVWTVVAAHLKARSPEEALKDVAWEEDFRWLVLGDDAPVPIRPAAVIFVNRERHDFQSECTSSDRILFGGGSDVNDWQVVWGDDTHLNYLGYGQG
jgi:hypothetical protein